jgi:uncharacterized protein (TIGR03790 family)
MKQVMFFLLFCFLCSVIAEAQTNANIPGPENVLVVYNSNIDSSSIIATYYQETRGIPSSNKMYLDLPDSVQITVDGVTHWVGIRQGTDIIRDIYNHNIGTWYATRHAYDYFYQYVASPIKDWITSHNLTNIKYLVLVKGIPCKLQAGADSSEVLCNVAIGGLLCMLNTDNYQGLLDSVYSDFRSRAIDANHYYYHPISGLENPYYSGSYGIDPNYTFNYRFASGYFTKSWKGFTVKLDYLVSHLDGISYNVVKGIIDRSNNPNMSGTAEWILDDDPYPNTFAHSWFTNARDKLEDLGFNVLYDYTDDWVTSYQGNVMCYSSYGTHAEDHNCDWDDSAWVKDSLKFTLANGAIFNTLESFNCNSLTTLVWRHLQKVPPSCNHTQGLATQWTEIGGTSTMGHAWEPYFYYYPWYPIVDDKKTLPTYAMGYNLVDAIYQGMNCLAWVNIIVGDPLTAIAWGKQTRETNTTWAEDNLVTDTVRINSSDTLTIKQNANVNLRIHGFIIGGSNLIVQSNVTFASDSWQRALYLANDNGHPKLVWSTNPDMSPIDYYKVFRKVGSGSWTMVDSTTLQYWTDNNYVYSNPNGGIGTLDQYYVKSGHQTNTSGASNTVSAYVNKSLHKETVQGQNVVNTYSLSQNYPNPFNPTTTINYSLRNDGFVSLKVYDILGREVRALVNENQEAGEHSVYFNASNLPSGVYIYRIQAGSFVSAKKMILIK